MSVIVPNYNYAKYIRQRLESVAAQSLAPYEIIVLDDASTDGSVAEIRAMQHALEPEAKLVINAVNGGSVVSQWLKGVELARGRLDGAVAGDLEKGLHAAEGRKACHDRLGQDDGMGLADMPDNLCSAA